MKPGHFCWNDFYILFHYKKKCSSLAPILGLTSMETRPPELQQCQGCSFAAVPRVETLF
jgi:hypothetical protein